MNLKNKIQEIENRIEETNDKVFIIITTRQLKLIKEEVEDYYKRNKEEQKRDYDSILSDLIDFEEDYLKGNIFTIKKYETKNLREELEPTPFELSLLETDDEKSYNKEEQQKENKPEKEEVNSWKNSLNYTGYFFQAKYNCPLCSNFVFINKIQDYVVCPHCNHKKTLDINWWKKNLLGENLLKEARELEENTALTSVTFGGENMSVAYGNGYPRCRECKDNLKENEYWAVSELKTATKKGHINCKKCNKSFSIRKTDEFTSSLFSYPVIAIFNEELEEDTNSESKTIAIHCISCGASLKVTDNKRSSTCKYCQTENILPDKLFKPTVPVQYLFYVLLKQKHKPYYVEPTEEEIDKEYLQLIKILTDRENQKKLSEKKTKRSDRISIFLILFMPLLFIIGVVLFNMNYKNKIIGYKERIPVENTSYTIVQEYFNEDNGWGIINSEGKEIVPTDFPKIEYIIGNLFMHKENIYNTYVIFNDKNEWLYKRVGKVEVIKKCDTCDFFGDGFALLKYDGYPTRIINSKGKIITSRYRIIGYNFENGNIVLKTKQKKRIFVLEKHGIAYKERIPLENTSYTIVQDFNKGWGVVNSEGKEIIPTYFSKIEYIIGNLFMCIPNGFHSYLIYNDKDEKLYEKIDQVEVIKECDTCDFFGDGFVLLKRKYHYTKIINSKGKNITECLYKITNYYFKNGNVILNTKKQNSVLVLDKQGNVISPLK